MKPYCELRHVLGPDAERVIDELDEQVSSSVISLSAARPQMRNMQIPYEEARKVLSDAKSVMAKCIAYDAPLSTRRWFCVELLDYEAVMNYIYEV